MSICIKRSTLNLVSMMTLSRLIILCLLVYR